MTNKVKYGLKNVYYALVTILAGVVSYSPPVALPGGVNLTLDPKGEKTEFYADDAAYFVADKNDGYEGSLEIALVPDSFKKDVLNYAEDANGALFEDANATVNKIALMFEFDGDAKKTRHVLYDVTPSRPAVNGKTTTNTKEPQTDTFDIVAAPASDTGYPKASIKYGQTGYSTFFDAVYTYQAVTNSLLPLTAEFSKAAPAPIVLTVTSSEANTINHVKKDGVILTAITNYTVLALAVTVLEAYLALLANGVHVFTIVPTSGLPVSASITVTD